MSAHVWRVDDSYGKDSRMRTTHFVLLLPFVISCSTAAVSTPPPGPPEKKTDTTSTRGMVVTCQPLAAQIGVKVLRDGGNAADAYIATTLAEYVTAYGYTSLSGPLYLLYFDSQSNKAAYLNAGLNTVADPNGQWDKVKQIPGTSYVIGGAAWGLDDLYRRFGNKDFSFEQLTSPASDLARAGFPISAQYAGAIRSRQKVIGSSPAWTSLFIKNGKPLSKGDILTQPEFADTLQAYGKKGVRYFIKGKFAKNLVRTIQSQGGKLTLHDLAAYRTIWSDPLSADYRGFKIATSSYRSYGGLQLLLGLKMLEHQSGIGSHLHFSKDEDLFETYLRTYLFSLKEVMPFLAGFPWSICAGPTPPFCMN